MTRLLCLPLVICLGASVFAQTSKPSEFELPKNKKAVVLSLDFRHGYTPPRVITKPFFEIRADGSMVARDVFRSTDKAEVEGRLSAKELQDLLRFVIEEQKFEAWSRAAFDKAMERRSKAGKPVPMITDASETHIQLTLPRHKKRASLYALSFVAQQLEEVAEVQRLDAVRKKLHQMMVILRVGGRSQIKKQMKALNAEIKKTWPKESPLKVEDLSHARRLREGGISLTFIRPLNKKKSIYAAVTVPSKGKPTYRTQEIARH